MSTLNEIQTRHGFDRIKDAVFIGIALLITAVSIGSLTRHANGSTTQHAWSVHVIESNPEIQASR